MSSPSPNPDQNRDEKGGQDDTNGSADRDVRDSSNRVDPDITHYRERDRENKRPLFRSLMKGAAFGMGKDLAHQQHLAERVEDFIHWISENI